MRWPSLLILLLSLTACRTTKQLETTTLNLREWEALSWHEDDTILFPTVQISVGGDSVAAIVRRRYIQARREAARTDSSSRATIREQEQPISHTIKTISDGIRQSFLVLILTVILLCLGLRVLRRHPL